MRAVIKNKLFRIVTAVCVFALCLFLPETVHDIPFMLKQDTVRTEAVIDFIGLPDGTVFVSCYDDRGVLHNDIIISNTVIQTNSEHAGSFYGKKIPVLYDADTGRALWLDPFYTSLAASAAVLLIWCAFTMIMYKKCGSVS